MKDFKELLIWQKAIEVFKMAAADVKKFPKEKIAFILSDQFLRSVSSVSANIAEGYGRDGDQEMHRFCQIAKGSLDESRDWIYKLRIVNYISEDREKEYEIIFNDLRKMLNSFMSQVRKRLFNKKSSKSQGL